MKHKFLIAIFCLGLLGLYFACEKDDSVVKEEQTVETQPTEIVPTLNTLTYESVDERFNRLKTELQIGSYFQFEQSDNVLSRTTQDTLGITIYTDVIKEVIAGNYLSYTMLIATSSTTDSKFYNLTIEDKNGEADMFVTKYLPSAEWLEDKSKAFKGDITTYRVDSFETVPIDDGGGTNDSDPTTTSEGSPFYPTDCGGYVYVAIELQKYPCDCGHWDIADCVGCIYGATYPGEEYIAMYYCVETNEGTNNSGNSGSGTNESGGNTGTGGGGSTNNNPDNGDQSIGAMVSGEEEVCEPPYSEWDTNEPYCRLDALEICNRDYPNDPDICDCVANGGELISCYDDYQIINELTGKALCVYNKLKSSSNGFKNAIKKFDGDFPVAHLKFEIDDTMSSNTKKAITRPPENYVIDIVLNGNPIKDASYQKRPNLLVAKTIIHEVIHAEIFRKILSLANDNGEIDVALAEQMLQQGDYPGILDYYTRFGINGFQHQQMAAHYRETIGRILQEFDTGIAVPDNQQPSQLYLDLAWEGLIYSNIAEWQSIMDDEERTRIENAISTYISENINEICSE